MLTFGEARGRLLEAVTRLELERVPLARARGRVLGEAVVADLPLPRFDFSAMDGYAVASGDDGSRPRPVAFEVRAGGEAEERARNLAPGTAARISTGAPIPPGSDAVVPQEEVTLQGDGVILHAPPRPGQNIRRRGEDIDAGGLALGAGVRIAAAQLGLLAALDRAEVTVARAPRVALITTGDELRAAGDAPRAGSIPDANAPMLAALAESCGAHVIARRTAADDLDALRRVVAEALAGADLVVTAGGVSVGARDFVREALVAEGVALDVVKVAMKPGKPLVFGRRGNAHVLALPGNPAAAFVTFATFGAPLLRALQGDARPLPRRSEARLSHPVRSAAGRTELARATLDGDSVTLLPNQSAGALTSLAWADALALLPGAPPELAAGARVEVIRIWDI